MASWFTAEKLSAIIRILSLIAAMMSGVQAVQGYQIVANRPAGVAGATADQIAPIGGNAILAGLFAIAASNKSAITKLLTALGLQSTATQIVGDVIDAGRLNNLRVSFRLAKTELERKPIRDAARIVADEIFDEHFPTSAEVVK